MFTSLQVKYQHVTGLFQNQFKQVILRFNISLYCKINSREDSPLVTGIMSIYSLVAETINGLFN